MAKRAATSRRPSIHDVAIKAGVSAATVSKVIRGVATVKPDYQERVNLAVASLGYRADPLASDLRRPRRRIIGAIVPEFESEFFGRLVTEFERLAEQRGYSLVAASCREAVEREDEIIRRMHDWRVAGVVVAPVRDQQGPAARYIKAHGMTGVLIDRVLSDEQLDTVSADSARASAEIARVLIGQGHRHVLVVGLGGQAATVKARLDGFSREAQALAPDCRIDVLVTESQVEQLRRSVRAYFDAGNRPTAVYSLFARGTLVALSEFRRRGWHCPQDVSLVGFDDAEWMQATWPSVAAVVQPVEDIARQAMDMLFERIEGREGRPRAALQRCTILLRESVGPAGAAPHTGGPRTAAAPVAK